MFNDDETMKREEPKKEPSLLVALIPFIAMIAFISIGILYLGIDPHVPLLLGTAVAAIVGMYLGYSWEYIENSVIEAIMATMQACLILMLVGGLIGTWVAGGVVPGMIYYGLQFFSKEFFLPVVVLLCSVVSLSTGSSWTTVGTFGIAALGIGNGLGVPPAMTAGAILCGAVFGDKMSPLSDTTNLAPAVAGTDVFTHVRHMMYTTVPSYIITLIIFTVISLNFKAGEINASEVSEMVTVLGEHFKFSPLIFIPPLFVLFLIIFKIPAVPGMFMGALMGCGFTMFQGNSLTDTANILMYGYNVDTGSAAVNELLNRGGIQGMMWSVSLVLIAIGFGGILDKTGCLPRIIKVVLHFCKTRGSIVLSNLVTCIAFNFFTADQYIGIVLPGKMYRDVYPRLNLHPKNLSRVLEDSATITSPLCPWSTCGAFYFSALGVSAFQYAPFAFFALINPVISAIYGFTGYSMDPIDKTKGTKYLMDATGSTEETPATTL